MLMKLTDYLQAQSEAQSALSKLVLSRFAVLEKRMEQHGYLAVLRVFTPALPEALAATFRDSIAQLEAQEKTKTAESAVLDRQIRDGLARGESSRDQLAAELAELKKTLDALDNPGTI